MGNVQVFLLVRQVGPGKFQAGLGISQVDVIECDVGAYDPLCIVKAGLAASYAGVGRLSGSPQLAEQVGLPGGIDPQAVVLDLDVEAIDILPIRQAVDVLLPRSGGSGIDAG